MHKTIRARELCAFVERLFAHRVLDNMRAAQSVIGLPRNLHQYPLTGVCALNSRDRREWFCQVAEGRASVTGTKHVSSISTHKSPHPRYQMPWREGHDSLLPAIDDAPVETDCGAGYEHSRIVAHVHHNESRAFGVLALGYVRVTLQHDCSRIDPGSVAQMA